MAFFNKTYIDTSKIEVELAKSVCLCGRGAGRLPVEVVGLDPMCAICCYDGAAQG